MTVLQTHVKARKSALKKVSKRMSSGESFGSGSENDYKSKLNFDEIGICTIPQTPERYHNNGTAIKMNVNSNIR